MENFNACSFTGHRPRRFSFGYDESSPDFLSFYEKLKNNIIQICNSGCRTFYTGMAEGVDLWCAEIVLDLKKSYFSDIKLFAVVPYLLQSQGMKPINLNRYRRVMQEANDRFLVSASYKKGCFAKRNQFLVESCDILLAVLLDGEERTGTAQTVRRAKAMGKKVVFVKP